MRTGRLAALSIERIDGEEVESVGQPATTRVTGVTISGVNVAALAAILGMADALDAVTLEGATLRYDDALLVRRLVDWWAQQEGMPVAQVAQNVADGVAETVHLAEPSLTEPARDAVRAFLLNPGSITLGLSPPQGVGLGQFLDIVIGAAETVPALGMTIEAGD